MKQEKFTCTKSSPYKLLSPRLLFQYYQSDVDELTNKIGASPDVNSHLSLTFSKLNCLFHRECIRVLMALGFLNLGIYLLAGPFWCINPPTWDANYSLKTLVRLKCI